MPIAETTLRALYCDRRLSMMEIAKELGVSRERVRQLEVATLKKIRQIIKKQDNPANSDINDD